VTEFFGQNVGQTYILTDFFSQTLFWPTFQSKFRSKKFLTNCISVAIVDHNFWRIGQNKISTIVFLTDCIRSKKLFSIKIMAFFGQKSLFLLQYMSYYKFKFHYRRNKRIYVLQYKLLLRVGKSWPDTITDPNPTRS